jgi:hypothetical protein
MVTAYELADSVITLLAEYTTIAQLADTTDWTALVHDALVDTGYADDVVAAGGFDALVSTMRRAEARGVDLAVTLPELVTVRELDTSSDVATVLDYRLTRWLDTSPSVATEDLIVGLFPAGGGDFSPDVVAALDERRRGLEARCELVIERAFEAGEAWVHELGAVPEGEEAVAWRDVALTVAAYRERWAIDDPDVALGTGPPTNATQRDQRTRAHAALFGLAISHTRSDTSSSPGALHRECFTDPSGWSLATLEDQLNIARCDYRRASVCLGIADFIQTLELQTIHDDIDDLERRRVTSPGDALLGEQLAVARESFRSTEASLGVAALIEEMELQALRDDAVAAEDAVNVRRHLLDSALGHDVLEGAALSRDVAVVRSHIVWSDAVLADQAHAKDPQEFARWRLDVEMRELRTQIKAATPENAAVRGVNRDVTSEERERLQYSLAARSADRETITGLANDGAETARVLADVAVRHSVDTEWLTAQKSALAALEVSDVARLAHDDRARTMVATTSYDSALETEPAVGRGFGIEPEFF